MPLQNQTILTSLMRFVFESEVTRLIAVIITVMGFVNYVVLPINEMRRDIAYMKEQL